MSIASGTEHYDYPQVVLTDRPTFADFNPAFRDIDSKLYGLVTGASTDHAAIETLQTGLGETNLLLASVKQTADGAKSTSDTNTENITLLNTDLGQTNRVVANKLDSVAIAEPYDATAGTYSVGDIVVYSGQRYKCVTAVAVAEPFDADKWVGEDVQTVVDELKSDLTQMFEVRSITLTNASLATGAFAETEAASLSGYDTLGIVGYAVSLVSGLVITGVETNSSNNVVITGFNNTGGAMNFTANVNVLYKRQ